MATYNGYVTKRSSGSTLTRRIPNTIGELRTCFINYASTRKSVNANGELRSTIRRLATATRKPIDEQNVQTRSVVGITAERPNINNIQLLYPRIVPIDYSWTKNIK